jgi:hypothetical protein
MRHTLLLALAVAASAPASAQDAVFTDGDKYTVLLENDKVRVLDYHDKPGDKTHLHHHDAFTLYALSAFKRRVTLPDGQVFLREFKPGDVMWSEAQSHTGENIGSTPTHVILVEIKPSPPAPIAPPAPKR